MIKLTVKDILFLHEKIIDKIGGIRGVRDIGLLEMAVNSPFASFGGEDLYKTLEEKAKQLCILL
ncbi:Fic family protein [Fusobacterium hominis]|uniref:Fic family protein n=1 Tax=Fusobacterium hominis TaxID=2764326 RepID=UPI002104C570|nr:Fic family protein [Fusobacterium hominis]